MEYLYGLLIIRQICWGEKFHWNLLAATKLFPMAIDNRPYQIKSRIKLNQIIGFLADKQTNNECVCQMSCQMSKLLKCESLCDHQNLVKTVKHNTSLLRETCQSVLKLPLLVGRAQVTQSHQLNRFVYHHHHHHYEPKPFQTKGFALTKCKCISTNINQLRELLEMSDQQTDQQRVIV